MVSINIADSGRKALFYFVVFWLIYASSFILLSSSKINLPGPWKCTPTIVSKGISEETLSKIYQVIHQNQASKEEKLKVYGDGRDKLVYGDLVLKLSDGTSHTIKGYRDPADRFQLYDYNFANKRYVEFGSNCGHNLFHVQHELKWGVGFEYNSGYVNIANVVKENMEYRHVSFYAYDMIKRNPSDVLAYLPENTVDVSVLFSVNAYLSNEVWGSYLDLLLNITEDVMLIEFTGSDAKKQEHIKMLKSKCGVDKFEDVTTSTCCGHRRLTICRVHKKQ